MTDEATAATEPEPAPAPASPPPPAAPTPPPSDSGSGLKAAALLLLLGGVGWNLFATMSTASKQGSSSVVPSPSRTSTTTPASKASSASPDSKAASKGSKDTKASKAEPAASKSGVTSVKAPPAVSDEGQVYQREEGKPIKPTATDGDWALVSPASKVYSIEVPKGWSAFEGGSQNDLMLKPPAPSKCSLLVVPFNAVDASDIPGEITKTETAYLGNPSKRDESTTKVDDEEAYLRSYVCNRRSGLERVEVLWVHNSGTQIVPIILRGPEAEVKDLEDSFKHTTQSFKNLVKFNGPPVVKDPKAAPPGADAKGGGPPTAGKEADDAAKAGHPITGKDAGTGSKGVVGKGDTPTVGAGKAAPYKGAPLAAPSAPSPDDVTTVKPPASKAATAKPAAAK